MTVYPCHANTVLVLMESTATLATVLNLVIQDQPVQKTLTNAKLTTFVILMRVVLTTLVLISVTVKRVLLAKTAMRILTTVAVTPAKMEVCVLRQAYSRG